MSTGATLSGLAPDGLHVSRGERAGLDLVILDDTRAGTQAILVPGLGFACIGFRVLAGGVWSVLAEPPDDESFLTRIGRYGVPIMFPWPNRIRAGRFTFGGREYQLPLPQRGPHAIHGVTRDRAWTVEQTGTDDGAFCRASITIGEPSDDVWPFPSRLTVEYRLHGCTLSIQAEAENIGSVSMPMGFGIHPWFDVPFGSNSSRAMMQVRAPADSFWELDETLCTTGPVRPVEDGFDARPWRPIEDRFIDDVYTGLTMEDGWFTAEIRDPANGRSIAVRSDSAFREHVVFAPLHSDVVCLEPYTCTTDAFNLAARGLDAGLIVLEPRQTWKGQMAIVARP
jgi:aldose 1-epimerase